MNMHYFMLEDPVNFTTEKCLFCAQLISVFNVPVFVAALSIPIITVVCVIKYSYPSLY